MLTNKEIISFIDYNPKTGIMVWRQRPRQYFKKRGDYLMWNRRYAGKRVGSMQNVGYLRTTIFDKFYLLHR